MERGKGNSEANTGEPQSHDLVWLKAPSTEGPEAPSATTATAVATATTPANGRLPIVQPLRLPIAAPTSRNKLAQIQPGVGEGVMNAPRLFSRNSNVGASPH